MLPTYAPTLHSNPHAHNTPAYIQSVTDTTFTHQNRRKIEEKKQNGRERCSNKDDQLKK
jgi:hypothetical protein